MSALGTLFWTEIKLATRVGGGAATAVMFFLCVVSVIPFAVGPDLNLLSKIGPAILWIGVLLATLLGLDRLFQADQQDGSLDLYLLSEDPLELVVLVKIAAHWTSTGLPLVLATPVLALFVNLSTPQIGAVVLTLLIGTPALTAIGAIGSALTASLRRGGVLVAVLVLPFTIPVLIFAIAASTAAVMEPDPIGPPLALLGALTLVSLVAAPFAAATALRAGME